jgi:hypothetical protein
VRAENLTLTIFVLAIGASLVNVMGLPSIDGTVSQGEYDSTTTLGNGRLNLYWTISGDRIFIAMRGETRGWISIGFEPSRVMKDADMIIGWFSGSSASVVDAYSTGLTGPHPADTGLGGTDDIISFDGSESGGFTTIELVRKLSTGDQYDETIPTSGSINIIWGMGNSDNEYTKHNRAGSGVMSMAICELLSIPAACLVPILLRMKVISISRSS